MRTVATFLFVLAVIQLSSAGNETGSLCVAPAQFSPKDGSAPGLYCTAEKLSLKLDDGPRTAWSPKNSMKLEGLDTTARHRVIIFCGGKPQQSFSFRFSEFKSNQLCLFLNGLYRTAQIWETKRSPWCKCK
jgi:hypothetical protein